MIDNKHKLTMKFYVIFFPSIIKTNLPNICVSMNVPKQSFNI